MEPTKEQSLLEAAVSEIKWLRRQSELAQARLNMFDDVMKLLHTEPALPRSGGMAPDIVQEIEKYLQPVHVDKNETKQP